MQQQATNKLFQVHCLPNNYFSASVFHSPSISVSQGHCHLMTADDQGTTCHHHYTSRPRQPSPISALTRVPVPSIDWSVEATSGHTVTWPCFHIQLFGLFRACTIRDTITHRTLLEDLLKMYETHIKRQHDLAPCAGAACRTTVNHPLII